MSYKVYTMPVKKMCWFYKAIKLGYFGLSLPSLHIQVVQFKQWDTSRVESTVKHKKYIINDALFTGTLIFM